MQMRARLSDDHAGVRTAMITTRVVPAPSPPAACRRCSAPTHRDFADALGRGAFRVLLAEIEGLRPAVSPPLGALVIGPAHRQVLQVQTDHAVVGDERDTRQRLPSPEAGPFGQPSADVRSEQPGEAMRS